MTPNRLLAFYGLTWNPFAPDVPVEGLMATPRLEHFAWRVEQLVRRHRASADHCMAANQISAIVPDRRAVA